ncbi:MAG: hypothetical protein HQM08_16130 [Candidatus Riflebacteria bacterium]|nr:hypothetical protein [Candidatus Riflebacteria bacterium]
MSKSLLLLLLILLATAFWLFFVFFKTPFSLQKTGSTGIKAINAKPSAKPVRISSGSNEIKKTETILPNIGKGNKSTSVKERDLDSFSNSNHLQQLKKDLADWPLSRSPDFWLFKAYSFQQAWKKARTVLHSALLRPQPLHFRFIFSNLVARVEFLLWMQKPVTAISSDFFTAFEKLGKTLSSNLKTGALRPGIGFLFQNSAASQPNNLEIFSKNSNTTVFSQNESTESLIASLTRELISLASEPDLIPEWLQETQAAQFHRCELLVQIANSFSPKQDFARSYAAVDFISQALRPISPQGPVARSQENEEWLMEFEKRWNMPLIPACSGKLLLRSRNNWICPIHTSGRENISNKPISQLTEAWTEFLFCNPESQPEEFIENNK